MFLNFIFKIQLCHCHSLFFNRKYALLHIHFWLLTPYNNTMHEHKYFASGLNSIKKQKQTNKKTTLLLFCRFLIRRKPLLPLSALLRRFRRAVSARFPRSSRLSSFVLTSHGGFATMSTHRQRELMASPRHNVKHRRARLLVLWTRNSSHVSGFTPRSWTRWGKQQETV